MGFFTFSGNFKELFGGVFFVKKSEKQHFCRKIFFRISNKFKSNFYHFETQFRHIASFMILKSNQGVPKPYQGVTVGSFTPGMVIDGIVVDVVCSNELLPQLYTTLSVENFPVGSLPVKSFPA